MFKNRPIFIIGNPRSGTSLLRLMLHSHPQICIPPESHFFLWLEDKYSKWNNSMMVDFLNDLFGSRKFETWNLNKEMLYEYLKEKQPSSYSNLISEIYSYYGMIHGKNNFFYWGDKNKLWKEKLNQIKNYFPNALFIHLIRDGRDVACSFIDLKKNKSDSKYFPNLPSEIDQISDRWNTNITFIENFLLEVEEKNKLIVKYEDLVTNTKKELQKIFTFLSLEYSEDSENYYQNKEFSDIEPIEFKAWKHKLTEAPDVDNIAKYKKLLSEEHIDLFNRKSGYILKKYGYLSSMSSEHYYNQIAKSYQLISERRRSYLDSVDNIIISSLKDHQIKNHLDAGSGDGLRALNLAMRLECDQLTLVDNSDIIFFFENQQTRFNGKIKRIKTSIDLIEPEEKYDLITCLWNVLGHVGNYDNRFEIFRKFKNILSEKGKIIIDVNNRYNISQYGMISVMNNLSMDIHQNKDSGWYQLDNEGVNTLVYIHAPFEIEKICKLLSIKIDKVFFIDYESGEIKPTFFEGQLLYILSHE